MKLHYLMTLLLIPIMALTIACEDADIISGKVQVSTGGWTGVVNNSIGVKQYGYVELKFEYSGDRYMVGATARVTSSTEGYGCVLDAMFNNHYGIYKDNAELITDPLPAILPGEHVIGCEVVNESGSDFIKMYFDGVLIKSQDITGSPDGKFGFSGLDAGGTDYVKSFKYYSQKPAND